MTFAYVSGSAALDLAGTRKWRDSAPEELLSGPDDLARWLDGSDDLPGGVTVGPGSFRAAVALREAIYRLASDRLHDRAFEPHSLDLVNRTARGPNLTPQLSDAGVGVSGDIGAVLADLARDAIAVLGDRGTPLKECGRPGCTRIYADRSRGARRAWCGMEECGNRVKAAAYRARRRGGVPD